MSHCDSCASLPQPLAYFFHASTAQTTQHILMHDNSNNVFWAKEVLFGDQNEYNLFFGDLQPKKTNISAGVGKFQPKHNWSITCTKYIKMCNVPLIGNWGRSLRINIFFI